MIVMIQNLCGIRALVSLPAINGGSLP